MIIKNLGKNFIINLTLILLIFLLDRISKIYVIHLDKKFLGSEIFKSKFLNIQLIWNDGIAFGLLSFSQKHLYNFLTMIILVVIIFIIYLIFKNKGIRKYSLIMIFGGALGNFYDRIFYMAVPDFIDFHLDDFHWFIFNVADIFITIGIIFMLILEFTEKSEQK